VILSQIEEIEDISVPWLEVDGERSWSLVSTLVDVSSSGVECSKHWNDTVRVTVGTGNVGTLGSDVVDVETDTTGSLGNLGTGLEGLVDTLDRVIPHGDKETRRHLGVGSTRVEQLKVSAASKRVTYSWGGVGKESLRHKVVGLEDLVNVGTVDTNSDSHHHVLRSLDNLAVDSKQIRPLEGLETKVVVCEISIVDD